MKDLLQFIIANITGSSDFEIDENREDSRVTYEVKTDPSIIGLVIGKEGKTIKNIRKILSVRATLEKVGVNISVNPKEA